MWNVYNEMEDDFLEFLDYVPPSQDHKKVYSYKLLRLMLQVGAYIDTAFKEMANYPKFEGNEKCKAIRNKVANGEIVTISLFRKAFEPIYDLSSRAILVKSPKHFAVLIDRLNPFLDFGKDETPKWWKAYNDVKHNWLKNLKKANIENVFKALGGAFLLNAIHEPSILELAHRGIVKTFLRTKEGLRQDRIAEDFLAKIIKRQHPLYDTVIMVDTRLFSWVFT